MPELMKTILDFFEEICEESEEAMDYISKAMVSSQMNKITKGLGLFDNDTNENKRYTYDPKKEREEEKRLAQKKIERDELMNKRKADRAAMRINIREKYGLKESKMDKELVQKSSKAQVEKKSSLEKKISLEKKDRLTRQKEMARRYNISPKKEKEKCSIM